MPSTQFPKESWVQKRDKMFGISDTVKNWRDIAAAVIDEEEDEIEVVV